MAYDLNRAMDDNVPDAFALQKIAANDFPEPLLAANEYPANSVQSILNQHAANPSAGQHYEIRMFFDPYARTLEVFDNGTGMSQAGVHAFFCSGRTGHASDASDGGVGPGGFERVGSGESSLCGYMLSAFGYGATAGGAALVRGDRGIALSGSIRVRSLQSIERGVAGAERNFDYMTEMKAINDDVAVWRTFREAPELEACEKALLDEAGWGPRFTRVIVSGVNESFCASLAAKPDMRLKAVACYEELYYAVLYGGVGNIECTKPPNGVRITLVIEFRGAVDESAGTRGVERYVLGQASSSDCTHVIPDILHPHPTTAWLLKRNVMRIEAEMSERSELLESLQSKWGPTLAFSAPVTLSLPAGITLPNGDGVISAHILLFYFPLTHDEELGNEDLAFGETSAGLFVVVNGQRLVGQPPIVPDFLVEPRRAPEGCCRRFHGLLFINALPTLKALDRAKTRLTPPFVDMIVDLDPDQIPAEICGRPQVALPNSDAPSLPASRPHRRRDLRERDPTTGYALASAPIVRSQTLSSAILTAWLPDMALRDASVRINEDEANAATLLTVAEASVPTLLPAAAAGALSSDWRLPKLSFMNKPLDTRKDGGLYVKFSPKDKRFTKTSHIGRVVSFICRGAKPGAFTSKREQIDMLVERLTADETNGDAEFVNLAQVAKKEWLDLAEDEYEDIEASAPGSLSIVYRDEDGAATPYDLTKPLDVDALPTWIGVRALTCNGSLYDAKLAVPLEASLERAGALPAIKTWTNVETAGGMIDAHGKRVPWVCSAPWKDTNVYWFGGLQATRTAPGTFIFSVRTCAGFFAPMKAQIHFNVRPRGASIVRCVWCSTDVAPAVPLGGELPGLALVATDSEGYVVDAPQGLALRASGLTCAVTMGGHECAQAMTLSAAAVAELEQEPVEMPWTELNVGAHSPDFKAPPPVAKITLLHGLKLDETAGFDLGRPAGKFELVLTGLALADCPAAAELTLVSPPPLSLTPGRPVRLAAVNACDNTPVLPGASTQPCPIVARDAFGNPCTLGSDGQRLRVKIVQPTGLHNLSSNKLEIKGGGTNAGCFVLPPMRVNGSFGGTAKVTLKLDSSADDCAGLQLRWPIERRAIAFTGFSGQEEVRLEGGCLVHKLVVYARAGSSLQGLYVRVHHAAGDAAAIGAHDTAFSPQHAQQVHLSAGPVQLQLVRGAASVPNALVTAQREVGTSVTFTATLGGARAELEVHSIAGPAKQVCLELGALGTSARLAAGAQLEVRVVLRDSSGALVRSAPAGLSFHGLNVELLSEGSSASAAALEMLTPHWRVEANSGGAAAVCTITLTKAGTFVLRPRGVAHSALAALEASRSKPVVVTAGPPSSLALELGGEGAYKHGTKFSLSARLLDQYGNTADVSDWRNGDVRVEGAGGVVLVGGPDGSSRDSSPHLIKTKEATAKWAKLFARLEDTSAPLPADGSIRVYWRKNQTGATVVQEEIALRLLPTGTAIRWLRVTSATDITVDPDEEFAVTAVLLLDDGHSRANHRQCIKASLSLEPTTDSVRTFNIAARIRPPRQHPEGEPGIMLIKTRAPSIPGVSTWRVRANGCEPVEIRVTTHAQQQAQPAGLVLAGIPPATPANHTDISSRPSGKRRLDQQEELQSLNGTHRAQRSRIGKDALVAPLPVDFGSPRSSVSDGQQLFNDDTEPEDLDDESELGNEEANKEGDPSPQLAELEARLERERQAELDARNKVSGLEEQLRNARTEHAAALAKLKETEAECDSVRAQ